MNFRAQNEPQNKQSRTKQTDRILKEREEISRREKREKISVIIVFKNEERALVKTLKCLLAQHYSSFEIICIDDASTDNSAQIVRDFHNLNTGLIKLIHFNKRKGISAARNAGIAKATGDILLFLDGHMYYRKYRSLPTFKYIF